jgi:hypothetical protein
MMPDRRLALPAVMLAGAIGCSAPAAPPVAPPATVAVAPPVVWKRAGDELRWLRSLSNPSAAQWQRREELIADPAVKKAADAFQAEADLMDQK